MDSVLVCVLLVQTQWRPKPRMTLFLCVLIRVSCLHTTGVYMYMHIIKGTAKVRVSSDDSETDVGDLLSPPLLPPLKRKKFALTSAGIMLYM